MNRPPESSRAAGSSINPHDHSYIEVFAARFGRGPGPVAGSKALARFRARAFGLQLMG